MNDAASLALDDLRDVKPYIDRIATTDAIPQPLMDRVIRASRVLDHEITRHATDEDRAAINAYRQWLRSRDLPTEYNPARSGESLRPGGSLLARSEILQLMCDHWQDPAGFHEAVARELAIREEEYQPPEFWRYTVSREVIDAAVRVDTALKDDEQLLGDQLDTSLVDDVRLVAGTIANDEGEAVDATGT